jgi:hypothetical protein
MYSQICRLTPAIASLLWAQHTLHHLTVMYNHIGVGMCGDKFDVFVGVVFVAVVFLITLPDPACIGIFVGQFVRLLAARAALKRLGTYFDEDVFSLVAALDGHGNKGGIDNLPAFEFRAQSGQRLDQTLK